MRHYLHPHFMIGLELFARVFTMPVRLAYLSSFLSGPHMIAYDRKHWVHLLFVSDGTILPRLAFDLICFFAATLALWACDRFVFSVPVLNPLGHTVMGVAVGMLIVFRNNCSYDRYWEGRKIWGTLVTQSRNLMRTATAFMTEPADDLGRLLTAYVIALKQHLRRHADLSEIEHLLPVKVYDQVRDAGNPPSVIAWHISEWIRKQMASGHLDASTGRAMDGCVSSLIDCQTGCERIMTTPLPFAYAVHIKQMLLAYLLTLPLVLLPLMGWMAAPAVTLIVFGLLGIETVGVEIEDPFDEDANDLPLESFCGQVRVDVEEMALLARSRAVSVSAKAA